LVVAVQEMVTPMVLMVALVVVQVKRTLVLNQADLQHLVKVMRAEELLAALMDLLVEVAELVRLAEVVLADQQEFQAMVAQVRLHTLLGA
jgi:hypothetical protein